eukprot:4521794-Prymnesium_polylepis.1
MPFGFQCSARRRLHWIRLHFRRRGRTQRCEGTQHDCTAKFPKTSLFCRSTPPSAAARQEHSRSTKRQTCLPPARHALRPRMALPQWPPSHIWLATEPYMVVRGGGREVGAMFCDAHKELADGGRRRGPLMNASGEARADRDEHAKPGSRPASLLPPC